jgi:hypothetical protein
VNEKTMLVVDDVGGLRLMMRKLLERTGHGNIAPHARDFGTADGRLMPARPKPNRETDSGDCPCR